MPIDFCLLTRAHRLCFRRSRRSKYQGTCWPGSVFHFSTPSLPMPKPVTMSISFNQINMDLNQHEYMRQANVPCRTHALQQCPRPQFHTTYTTTSWQIRFAVSATRRHAFLCHTPRKSLQRAILTSLTCAYHSQTWTKRYESVVRAFW